MLAEIILRDVSNASERSFQSPAVFNDLQSRPQSASQNTFACALFPLYSVSDKVETRRACANCKQTHASSIYIYMCICVYVYIYVYMYI